MKKKGITVSTLIVYVVLFYLFTTFVVMISSNINNKIFLDRGKIQNQRNASKSIAYILNSSKNSSDVNEISSKIVFSNNDEYMYKDNCLYKNDKIVLRDLEKFEYSIADIAPKKKSLNVTLKFKKYTQELEKTYQFIIGGGVYE